ncbi:CAMK/MLCK protein kinase [Loa loa]|uniref:CAMK/MLCK protein kinase n=1 Tax=Loa loa TaxID=7209 RepID=A0A1S0UI06_LOALO|nr:CAMK/MLCK protein kinase [Loa loa]EJD74527.1 CAMK/MLCK protein kinase [Loa loa]
MQNRKQLSGKKKRFLHNVTGRKFSGMERKPHPDVEWLDTNGKPIATKSDRFKVTTVGRLTTLTVLGVDNDVQGKYLLKVKNELGEAKCEILVEVLERPVIPGRPILEKQKFNSVSLQWNTIPQAANQKVEYIVEMKKQGEEEWVKVVETVQLNVTVKELESDNTYRFRVRASIAGVISEPSEESESFFVGYEKLEKKENGQVEKQNEAINYDELFTDVKPLEYRDIDMLKLSTDFESKYILCEKIGIGAYGTIYRAIERATGKNWAAKMIKISPDMKKDVIMHEVEIMNELHHEKLLNLHEVFDMDKGMCLIEEFISGGDLHDKIIRDEALMSEDEARTFIRQILQGIQYMHNKGIVHLDLKLENIMLTSNESNDIKIIDFGLAQKLDANESPTLLFCTAEFCSPEVINKESVGLSADMWAVGVITYSLLSGLSPFAGTTNQEIMANVSSCDWNFRDVVWEEVSNLAKDFIAKLVVKNKSERMTVTEALAHPWITTTKLKAKRGKMLLAKKKDYIVRKNFSDVLIPIGKLAKTGAIFRRRSMDGTFERNIKFEVNFLPRLLKNLEDVIGNVGDQSISLMCEIEALPQPVIQWFKDDKEICMKADKYEAKYEGCIVKLNIKNVVNTDSGVYSIIATNALGSIRSEAKVSVEKVKEEKKKKVKKIVPEDKKEAKGTTTPFEFNPKLADVSAKVSDSILLSVAINSHPESEVQWFRNDEAVDINNPRFIIKKDNGLHSLKILSCEITDTAKWKVVARNATDQCESECNIIVEVSNDFKAPEFKKPLVNIQCEETSMVTLEVGVLAKPLPEIIWYFGDHELHEGERYKLQYDEDKNIHSITIVKTVTEDSGTYTCCAKNLAGTAETTCSLVVNQSLSDKRSKEGDKAPIFQMPLTDCNLLEGDKLTLVCAITGVPNPSVKWFKNDKILNETDCTTKYENGTCTLTIASVKPCDAGVYKCTAENISGTSRSECKVHIQQAETMKIKPYFEKSLTNISINSGSEVVLECKVIGKPKPKITWYKDGMKLLLDNRMSQHLENDGSIRLNIINISANDSGVYSCEAVNAFGKDLSKCTVEIIDTDVSTKKPTRKEEKGRSLAAVNENLKAPVIIRPLEDVTIYEGNHKILEVEVEAYPQPMIEWFLNSKILKESRDMQTYFDGSLAILKINDAHIEQQGEYLCRASNKGGSAETRCNVIVKEDLAKDEMSKMPEFIEKMQNVRVKNEGDALTLKCKVTGKPKPEIRWLLNGKAIAEDDKIRIRTFDDGICVMEITRLKAELCGTYTAIAHNIYGNAHANAEISLDAVDLSMKMKGREPFFLVEPIRNLVIEESTTLHIVCDIDGEPEPKVTWFKDHSLIKDDRFAIQKEGTNHQITIASVLLSDEGVYTVEAENSSGKIFADIVVHVIPKSESEACKEKVDLSKPSISIGQPYATQITKNTLQLKWTAPEDGDSKIEYVVEQRRPDDQTWTQVGATVGTELLITGLQPSTEYKFRVSVKNKVGQTAYSPPSTAIMTLPSGQKPVLKNIPPATLIFNEKEDIELSVEFEGEPTPFVKWYHDGIELIDGKNSVRVTTVTDKSSKLIIKKPKASVHVGLYSCHIGNEAGETVCETHVIKQDDGITVKEMQDDKRNELLEGQPQIVVPLSNETTAAGQQFILSCKIMASPKGVVSWFRNDERLAPIGRFEMLEQDNIYKLICHNAQGNDSATYRCIAKNPIGIAQSSCEVTVLTSTQNMAPKFEVALKDKTALANKEVKLKCRILGDPRPQVTWMKDGAMISTTRRQKLEFTEDGWCSLTIFNCTAEDTGFYLCTACNVLGSASSHLMLTVAEIAGPDSHLVTAQNKEMQYCKPRFTRVPGAVVETTEGSTVKLISRAVGLPKPLVRWFKDEKEITKVNRAYEILLTGEGESVLLVPYAVTKTAGIFKCVAENSEGSTSFEMQLVVHTLLHKQNEEKQAPRFTMDLTDIGVAIGYPVTLKCLVTGTPEPQLKWIFINDAQQTSVLRTTTDSAWAEYRQGDSCEMKTESVVKTQQGTYQCIASNEHGRAITQCYLLVGEPFNQPAGPPRFLKCLRDIWVPLGEDIEFEVEVSGYPLSELTWYHLDEKVHEEKNIQISYITPTKCQLKITSLSVSHLGTYSVEASNIHGIVRTTASLNVGKKLSEVESPKFPEDSKEKLTTVLPQDASSERPGLPAAGMHRVGTRLDVKRKGAAPAFLIGLEDLEFREGDAAALAGTVAKRRRHRIHGRSDGKRIKQFVTLKDMEIDASASSSSLEPQIEITTLEEIRASIAERNKNICRPKFMVKPKPKKSIAEHKSLRLRTAISANPVPVVRWDKAGIVLETGNKYSIYNDGDFYYLEVHHVSKIDEGFYNCSASNTEGFVTCTAEIEVVPGDGTRRLRKGLAAPSFIEVLPGKFKAINGDPLSVECSVSGYPAPTIQWLRNGSILLPEHDRYLISYDGETTTLNFVSIAASDTGKYVCIAKNQEGEAKTAMQLDVEPRKISPTGGTPPKFRSDGRRETVKAMDGDKVVLLAELIEGSEPITIQWIRNKMEIQNSSGFGYSREEANCYLTIADTFPEDAGVYTCEARNEFGVAKFNVRLVVTERKKQSGYENPPVIVNAPTNMSVEHGNDLILSVTVRGYPEPAVIWTKNMVSIASGEKYQMANNGDIFTLTIRNCTKEDRGKYELQAVNLSGTAKAIIAVDVTEVTNLDAVMPRFTKLPISIQSAIGQKASLTCNFKGLQSTVTWFHDDKKLVSGRHGIEISSTATTSTLSILQLADEHLGEYLCAVRNEYGEDLAKAAIFLEGSSVALSLLNGN